MKRLSAAFLLALALGSLATLPEEPRPGWLGLGYSYHVATNPKLHNWLFVQRLAPGGPADRAGLHAQDIINAIDDKPLLFANETAVINFFEGIKPGQALLLTVVRASGTRKIRVVAEPMSDAANAMRLQNRETVKHKGRAKP